MNNYKHFQHRNCEYFPCHKTIDKTSFNCLFCYCPLYFLGKNCGGEFVYLANGIKDCSNCVFPHEKENYSAIIEKIADIVEIIRQNDGT